jgi:uncharacterized protein YndB with AHSA1/START domain
MNDAESFIEINVRERILRPIGDVFNAVVDPEVMVNYFISSASGPMRPGPLTWVFADLGATVAINVLEVKQNERIVWESTALGQPTRSAIDFASDGNAVTVVTVTEGLYELTQKGAKLAMGQTAGWTYTLCCMKAYLQYGIHLRKGLNKRITDVAPCNSASNQ